jgi:hypothetical protein
MSETYVILNHHMKAVLQKSDILFHPIYVLVMTNCGHSRMSCAHGNIFQLFSQKVAFLSGFHKLDLDQH